MDTNELAKLSVKELRTLNEIIIDLIKAKLSVDAVSKKHLLKIGKEVTIDDKKFKDDIFIVHKINKKNAVLKKKGSDYRMWNVPISLINI